MASERGGGVGESGVRPARRVLLVEDDPLLHEIVFDTLSGAGFEVIGAMTAHEAQRLIEGGYRPEVAVIDIRLPDGDGADVCRALKATHPAVHCVIFSAHEAIASLASDLGADSYVSKARSDFVAQLLHAIG